MCACGPYEGSLRDESLYIFDQIKEASHLGEYGVDFKYHLGSIPICRDAFLQFLGLPCKNTRALSYETLLRQGYQALPQRERWVHKTESKEALARQYVHAYCVVHSDKSPSHPIFWLEQQVINEVFKEYSGYIDQKYAVKSTTFRKLWYSQIKVPCPDPETGDMYKICIKKRRAMGFKKCNQCSSLEFAVMMARGKCARQQARNNLLAHLKKVKAVRTGLNAARLDCNGTTIRGFSVDGADYGKFPTPVTKSTAAVLGGMKRIKNKITGVEFFSGSRQILIFRSLPNITTGANLTLTIICRFVVIVACMPYLMSCVLYADSSAWAILTKPRRYISIGMVHMIM